MYQRSALFKDTGGTLLRVWLPGNSLTARMNAHNQTLSIRGIHNILAQTHHCCHISSVRIERQEWRWRR